MWRQTKFRSQLNVNDSAYKMFNRNAEAADAYGASTLFMGLQPLPAIIAITGCVVIFAFCSATWWLQPITFPKVAIAYAAQFIVVVNFLILKIRRWLKPKIAQERDQPRKHRRPMSRTEYGDFTRIVNDLSRMQSAPDTGDDLTANVPRFSRGNISAYEMRNSTGNPDASATEQPVLPRRATNN